jgi:hypothetical protein
VRIKFGGCPLPYPQDLLYSNWPGKNVSITTILSLVPGIEMLSLALMGELRLRVFVNRGRREVAGDWR